MSETPGSWTSTTFGDVIEKLVNGGTPPTDELRYWGGDIPWVTGADFTPSGIGEIRRFVTPAAIANTSTNVVSRGSLLIVTRTGVGKLAIAPFDIAVSQDVTGAYPNKKLVDVGFLYQRIRQGVLDLARLNQGTSINGVVRRDLVGYPIRLPDLPVQRRIAEVLSTVDEAIEQTGKLIAKHQQVKVGLTHDLFTRGLTPDGHLRPLHSEAPQLYEDSPLGLIPKEWEIHRAESLTAGITKGTTPSGLVEEERPDFVPFIRVQNLSFDGSLAFESDVMFVARAVHVGVLARSIVYPGDVLMNIVGPPLGKVSIVPDSHAEWNINQAIAVFRLRNPELCAYMASFLLSAIGQSWLARRAKRTSGQVNLTLELCRDLPIPMPRDDSERDLIARVLGACDQAIGTERDFLRKLNREKCGLMHDLLTGEVTVPIPETDDA